MKFKYCLFCIILIEYTYEIEIDDQSLNLLPDYDFYGWVKQKDSELRRRFLDRKQDKKNQDYRIKLFEQLSKSNIYVDDILHSEIDERNPRYKFYERYEMLFKNVISMNGVKYVYRRDFFWRTWRRIDNNNTSVVFYTCKSFNTSSTQCGHWIIEEGPPPCPYEIFSLVDTKTLCVIEYTSLHRPIGSCPMTISLDNLLATCSNPVVTKWSILRNYSSPDRDTIDICQGSDSCVLTTSYTINTDSIIFRLINSSQHILYSRVMKSENQNYACDDDCGSINLETLNIIKNDKHVVLNLLNYNQKNKRENVLHNKTVYHKSPTKKSVYNNGVQFLQASKTQTDKKPVMVKKSPCKIIQDHYLYNNDNDSDYDYPVQIH